MAILQLVSPRNFELPWYLTPQFALVPRNMSNRTNHATTNRKRYIRKYQNINLQKFNQDLDKINWDTTGLEDIHEYGNNFL